MSTWRCAITYTHFRVLFEWFVISTRVGVGAHASNPAISLNGTVQSGGVDVPVNGTIYPFNEITGSISRVHM